MSEITDDDTDWLEKLIANEWIKYYEYSDFKNIQKIGNGSFGSVVRANWKDIDTIFVLKSFNNNRSTLKEVVKEIRLHLKVHFHANILTFYGITKIETDTIHHMINYVLVLEYADSGTLNTYLNEHFGNLGWEDKLGLALQLANAVLCLHKCGVIHRDLHADNILVHDKNIKVADFGLSKKIVEASSNTSDIFGVIPYVDPKIFNRNKNQNQNHYILNEKSDVYSVGVLMWQISSGRQPFKDIKYDVGLALKILGGEREEIIDDTPIEYSNLYTECWKYEPDERPNMQNIVSILKAIISLEQNSPIPIFVNKVDSLEKYKSTSEQNVKIMDQNSEYGLNLDYIEREINLSSQVPNLQSNIDKNYSSNLTKTTINTVKSIFNNINQSSDTNMVVAKLIEIIIKKHDQGITFYQINQLINKQILRLNQDTDRLKQWLSQNQVERQHIWFLGLFYYYYNIDKKENSVKAFKLFSKAAAYDYPIAQVYLAKCYNDGYGTERNKYLAFKLYQKSAENDSIIGQFYLGYCYEHGIGIEKNNEKSIFWYKKAAHNENITAKLYLAECYRLGKGVKKNEIKAFKYYKILAEQEEIAEIAEIADAQHQLGNCFYYGIGTRIDTTQALCWYTKATNNGNIIAKDMLEKHYNQKNKIHKILFSKKLSQLGLYYVGKILIKTNYEKSFYYFQKSAENGYKVAQFNLGNCYRIGEGVDKDERKAFELFKKSADQDYINGIFRLGYCYFFGIGTDINKAKAIEFYEIAAEKENSGAQNNLGLLYKDGDSIEKNLNKAIYLFNRAAKNGNEVAQYNLGNCYKLGIGVEKDEVKAFDFYKKSAEQKYLDGKFQLGNCYNEGIGTNINKGKAFILYKGIAKRGHKIAQNSLGILYENGEGTKKDLDKAIHWFYKAAINGNEVAQYNLGLIYEHGKGVTKDNVKAFQFYLMSAEKEHPGAQLKVLHCYETGIGTVIDNRKAHKMYEKIAERKLAQSNIETEKISEMAFY